MRTFAVFVVVLFASMVACRVRVRRKRQALDRETHPDARWPDGTVIVVYDDLDLDTMMLAIEAQYEIVQHTCVAFIEDEAADETPRQRLTFAWSYDRCLTPLGRTGNSTDQPIYISENWLTKEDLIHETLHALGIGHTQNRPDAADYVQPVKTNIHTFNLNKIQPWTNLAVYDVPYDYGSIMHFDAYRYARNTSAPTLLALDEHHQETMGSMTGLSFYDIKLLNAYYNCNEACDRPEVENKADCKNGGYPDPLWCSACICPTTYDGDCEQKDASVIEVDAREEFQTLNVSFEGDGTRTNWDFRYYWIKVDPGYIVEVQVDVTGPCSKGCLDGGVEVKAAKDKAATGYRICCDTTKGPLFGEGAVVPLIFFNRKGPQVYSIRYRAAVNPVHCDSKYDLFVDVPGEEVLTQSLLNACKSSGYLDDCGIAMCKVIAYEMNDVIKSNASLDTKLIEFKTRFDVFTDSDNIEARANFTKTAVITGWGTVDQLRRCRVTTPPTPTTTTSTSTTTKSTTTTTTTPSTTTTTTDEPTTTTTTTTTPSTSSTTTTTTTAITTTTTRSTTTTTTATTTTTTTTTTLTTTSTTTTRARTTVTTTEPMGNCAASRMLIQLNEYEDVTICAALAEGCAEAFASVSESEFTECNFLVREIFDITAFAEESDLNEELIARVKAMVAEYGAGGEGTQRIDMLDSVFVEGFGTLKQFIRCPNATSSGVDCAALPNYFANNDYDEPIVVGIMAEGCYEKFNDDDSELGTCVNLADSVKMDVLFKSSWTNDAKIQGMVAMLNTYTGNDANAARVAYLDGTAIEGWGTLHQILTCAS